ncbi:MAG: NAD-dependent epimerase/dehydratase family protein, partial [Desulfobacteraceae bacterium]|nr:NAD-dependent epimerase/dehydratase family protein [Desulfobacteraceae bacterium]
DTSGKAKAGRDATVQGTGNVLSAAIVRGVKQLIYISTCNVYGIVDCKPFQTINEDGPLERNPERRGLYSNSKFKAEQIVLEAIRANDINITCVRPGTIWGPGGETFTPMIGVKIGRSIIGIIGSRKFILPLVYLDNLVDAIVKCIGHSTALGKVYNMVDDYHIDKATYVRQLLKKIFPKCYFFTIPFWALYIAVLFQEIAFKLLHKEPYLSRYRLISSQRCVVYDSGRIKRDLNWKAPMSFQDGVHEVLKHGIDKQQRQIT